MSGPANPNWKGGRLATSQGYLMVLVQDDHPLFEMAHCISGSYYILEHRLIMAKHLSRPLTSRELVHHINENKHDNRIENLELTDRGDHPRKHRHRRAVS